MRPTTQLSVADVARQESATRRFGAQARALRKPLLFKKFYSLARRLLITPRNPTQENRMTARTVRPKTAAAVAASVLIAGFAIATHTARAQGCGTQADILTHADPLMAPVQPADCATVLHAAPQFAWPSVRGANAYTIALTFPDGHTESRWTKGNWFAWDRPVPAGRYQWRVIVAGRTSVTGAARWFEVDGATAS